MSGVREISVRLSETPTFSEVANPSRVGRASIQRFEPQKSLNHGIRGLRGGVDSGIDYDFLRCSGSDVRDEFNSFIELSDPD